MPRYTSVSIHERFGEYNELRIEATTEEKARLIAEAQLLGGAVLSKLEYPNGKTERVRLDQEGLLAW